MEILTEEIYLRYEKLIMKMAWKFVNSTGYDFEDIFSIFKVRFCMAYEKFNPEKGKFSTLLYTELHNMGVDLIIKNQALKRINEVRLGPDDIPEQIQNYTHEDQILLLEQIIGHEEEVVRVIGGIIFSHKFSPKSKKTPKKYIQDKLKTLSFKNKEIRNGIKIIKTLY